MIRTHLLDASALVKVVVDEKGSENVREYFKEHNVFYMTQLCFGEALGVLKRKYINEQKDHDAYRRISSTMIRILSGNVIFINDDISKNDILSKAEEIIEKHKLDISDAFQIASVSIGSMAMFADESETILVTADKKLAGAARREGLRVWDCENESKP